MPADFPTNIKKLIDFAMPKKIKKEMKEDLKAFQCSYHDMSVPLPWQLTK